MSSIPRRLIAVGFTVAAVITAPITVELVLAGIDLTRLLDDPPRLLTQPLKGAVLSRGRVRGQLRGIDRDRPDVHHPRPPAERQHLHKQL